MSAVINMIDRAVADAVSRTLCTIAPNVSTDPSREYPSAPVVLSEREVRVLTTLFRQQAKSVADEHVTPRLCELAASIIYQAMLTQAKYEQSRP